MYAYTSSEATDTEQRHWQSIYCKHTHTLHTHTHTHTHTLHTLTHTHTHTHIQYSDKSEIKQPFGCVGVHEHLTKLQVALLPQNYDQKTPYPPNLTKQRPCLIRKHLHILEMVPLNHKLIGVHRKTIPFEKLQSQANGGFTFSSLSRRLQKYTTSIKQIRGSTFAFS